METIKLSKTEQGWTAKHSDPKVMKLFGTDTLPTAYTAKASYEMVKTQIQALNVGVDVS